MLSFILVLHMYKFHKTLLLLFYPVFTGYHISTAFLVLHSLLYTPEVPSGIISPLLEEQSFKYPCMCWQQILSDSDGLKIASFYLFIYFLLFFLGTHPQIMKVPRLGVKQELQLLAYATDTATLDPSRVFGLYHSSQATPDP